MKRFDTHVHLTDMALTAGGRLAEALLGAEAFLCCATSLADSRAVVSLAAREAKVFAAIGVHPAFCDEQALPHLQESLEDILRVQPERIRAVGEIGLDARKGQPPQVLQEAFLREQLSFAGAHGLPVSLHCVQAAQRLWEALRAEGIRRGAVHGFSAGRELARQFLDQGMYLGIGMAASRENARRAREAIAYAPLDRLLLETDSPSMPPPGYGAVNMPETIRLPARVVAEIKQLDIETVWAQTFENACTLFSIEGEV